MVGPPPRQDGSEAAERRAASSDWGERHHLRFYGWWESHGYAFAVLGGCGFRPTPAGLIQLYDD
jgi:hypothetical protein